MTCQTIQLRARRLVPAWHTALTVLLLFAISAWGASAHHLHWLSGENDRAVNYLISSAGELLVAAFVIFGIRLGGNRLGDMIGGSWWRPIWILRDIGLAVAFMIVANIVLALFYYLLYYLFHPQINGAWHNALPHSAADLACWMVLCITAGFCEELIFRGYLQAQFAGWTGSRILGVLIQGAIFGLAHGYQGAENMSLLAVLGCLFGLLVLWRRSLRPGMLAHFLQDALAGLVYFAR